MKSSDLRSLWRRERFVWGRTDCLMSVCAYVAAVTGTDPAAPWRGTYDDEAGARRILAAGGGVLAMMRGGMAAVGFQTGPRGEGRPVVCQIGGEEIAGVDMGPRIAFMAAGRGMVEMRADVLEAWVL